MAKTKSVLNITTAVSLGVWLFLSVATIGRTACAEQVVAPKMELWLYCPANLLVDTQIEKVEGLIDRAAAAGYTHMLLTDAKFSRLHEMPDRYFANVASVIDHAHKKNIEIIPAIFPVGYSNDILGRDPNLAEGMHVEDALYVVDSGIAEFEPDSPVNSPAMNSKRDWAMIDEAWQLKDKIWSASGTRKANLRLMSVQKVTPNRHYHVAVDVKTASFSGQFECKVLDDQSRSLSYTFLGVQPSQEWTTHHITFNSLDESELKVYLGTWDLGEGSIELRNVVIEECGSVNMLRRPGTPLRVELEQGSQRETLTEGEDFERFYDPKMGTVPFAGAYEVWHEAPVLKLKRRLPDGSRLRVSYYHTHIIYDGQVVGCVTEPAFDELLETQAKEMVKVFPSNDWMMSHDEWRMMGWDLSFARLNKTPGQVMADNLQLCTNILKKDSPSSRIAVWSDMFDPYHNSVDDYYLVKGSLKGSWEGLSPDVLVVNWNSGKKSESLKFFAERGNRQVIAGYYDTNPQEIDAWLKTIREEKIPGVIAIMYTTWQNKYDDLEAFAARASAK